MTWVDLSPLVQWYFEQLHSLSQRDKIMAQHFQQTQPNDLLLDGVTLMLSFFLSLCQFSVLHCRSEIISQELLRKAEVPRGAERMRLNRYLPAIQMRPPQVDVSCFSLFKLSYRHKALWMWQMLHSPHKLLLFRGFKLLKQQTETQISLLGEVIHLGTRNAVKMELACLPLKLQREWNVLLLSPTPEEKSKSGSFPWEGSPSFTRKTKYMSIHAAHGVDSLRVDRANGKLSLFL